MFWFFDVESAPVSPINYHKVLMQKARKILKKGNNFIANKKLVPEFLGWLLWNILKCLLFYVHTITGNFVGLEFVKTSLSLYYFKSNKIKFFKWFDWEAVSSTSSVNYCVVNRKVSFLDSITVVPQNWLAALFALEAYASWINWIHTQVLLLTFQVKNIQVSPSTEKR